MLPRFIEMIPGILDSTSYGASNDIFSALYERYHFLVVRTETLSTQIKAKDEIKGRAESVIATLQREIDEIQQS